MARSRLRIFSQLFLLLGLPLILLSTLMLGGVYVGDRYRAGIVKFEKEWLGIEVKLPPGALNRPPPSSEGTTTSTATQTSTSQPASTAPSEPTPTAPTPSAPVGESPTPRVPAEPSAAEPPAAEPSAAEPSGGIPDTPAAAPGESPAGPPISAPAAAPSGDGAGIEVVAKDLQASFSRPLVVDVKLLVDPSFVAAHPDWVEHSAGLLRSTSRTFSEYFGIHFRLHGLVQWDAAARADAGTLLDDLRTRPREGAQLLIGLSGRAWDGKELPGALDAVDESQNGAYLVVFAGPGDEAYVRTLPHMLSRIFGAQSVEDEASDAFRRGSWMALGGAEPALPWIDDENRRRVLNRKHLPFVREKGSK